MGFGNSPAMLVRNKRHKVPRRGFFKKIPEIPIAMQESSTDTQSFDLPSQGSKMESSLLWNKAHGTSTFPSVQTTEMTINAVKFRNFVFYPRRLD